MNTDPERAVCCQSCLGLELTTEKFIITADGPREEVRPTAQYLRKANEPSSHGHLDDIRARSARCPLCRLIVESLDGSDIPGDSMCQLRWEIDGRPSVDSVGRMQSHCTRRLRICWAGPHLHKLDSYIVLGAQAEDFEVNIDYRKRLNDQNRFLGRKIGPAEYKRNLIRQFLRICETDHDKTHCSRNLGNEDPFCKTLKEPYFGVIDTQNDCIVPLPFNEREGSLSFEPYATMSYVWGVNRDFKTKTTNVRSRCQEGGLASVIPTLPRSLREGIGLVRDLGIRYIWIDALCIVQDSLQSWALNSRVMDQIYGNATLTVCAADGHDGNAGLLALHEDHQPTQPMCRYSPTVRLLLRQPSESSILKSTWNTRAWTFQERLLSKCCLIFTGGRIHFQCRSACLSEDIFADREGRGWSLDLVRAPLQLLSELKCRAMWFYAHCVFLYTQRDLFQPLDILAAFSGMCKLMEGTFKSPLIFALPSSHFDLALLWVPMAHTTRLKHSRNDDPRYAHMKFPSWSWCGWRTSGIRYDPAITSGCTEDPRSWLQNHTWIDWHIRDGSGTLRRVWDRSNGSCEDISTDVRWRGYEVKQDVGDNRYMNDNYGETNFQGSGFPLPARCRREAALGVGDAVQKSTTMYRTQANTIRTHEDRSPSPPRMPLEVEDKMENYDSYGRSMDGMALTSIPAARRTDFKLTLPEYPYNVSRSSNHHGVGVVPSGLSDQPFLQFFTWRADFHVVRSMTASGETLAEGLSRCHITDLGGDKCGSIVVDTEWLERQESESQTRFQFIAISDAKSFTEAEFPDWTYFIPKEREESEWDLFFVLLVERDATQGVHRRVALGKIFKAGFARTDDEWTEIILG